MNRQAVGVTFDCREIPCFCEASEIVLRSLNSEWMMVTTDARQKTIEEHPKFRIPLFSENPCQIYFQLFSVLKLNVYAVKCSNIV